MTLASRKQQICVVSESIPPSEYPHWVNKCQISTGCGGVAREHCSQIRGEDKCFDSIRRARPPYYELTSQLRKEDLFGFKPFSVDREELISKPQALKIFAAL